MDLDDFKKHIMEQRQATLLQALTILPKPESNEQEPEQHHNAT